MNATTFLHLYRTNAQFLRWALLAWVISIAASLGLNESAASSYAEPLYQSVTLAGLAGLLLFGLLNIYFGVIKDFSATQILVSTAALFIGSVGLSAVFAKLSLPWMAAGCVLFMLGMGGVWHGLGRQRKTSHEQEPPARPMDDATIRGSASLFAYGSDKYAFVERMSTGRNTPAEQFEKRLIRHIERAMQVQPISRKGTGACYWNFRLKAGGLVELVVIGPGYNTSALLREGERWLLRIREEKPGFFTNWMREYFAGQAGMERDLGSEIQTQFASSQLADENAFFAQNIEVPVVGIKLSPEAAIGLLNAIEQAASHNADNGEAEKPDKPTLH
ncbi:MAG: hypothetical protein ABFE02_06175 [Sulfuricella sp.]